MQITIDTKHDSKEDLKKLAAFLMSLSGSSVSSNANLFSDSSPAAPAVSDAFTGMFGAEQQPPAPKPSAFSIYGDEEKPEKEEKIEIIPY